MEITTTNLRNATSTKSVASSAQQKVATNDTNAQNASVAGDSVRLSEASLKRAQSTAQGDGAKVAAVIENAGQARQVAQQVASEISNSPSKAQQAYGNLSQLNFKQLLA